MDNYQLKHIKFEDLNINTLDMPQRKKFPVDLKEKAKIKTKISLFDYQKAVVEKIPSNNVICQFPTGFGKTIIALWITQFFVSSLVLVPRTIIKDQWLSAIKKFKIKNVEVFMIPSINLWLKRKDKIKNLKIKYSLIIIDEMHMFENALYTIILPQYIYTTLIGLSATPKTDSYEIYSKFFTDILCINVKKVFNVIPIHTTYKVVNLPIHKYGRMRGKIDYNQMLKDLSEDSNRSKDIINYITKIKDLPVLILVKRVKFIKDIENGLQKAFKNTKKIETIYGTKDSFSTDSDFLIGTYQKMGVGVDTCHFNSLVITDNIKDVKQSEGRLRNENFTLYDFVDSDTAGLFYSHWLERKKWYINRGATVFDFQYLT